MMRLVILGVGIAALGGCVLEDEPVAPVSTVSEEQALTMLVPGGPLLLEARSIDGTGNNRRRPWLGSAGIELLRVAPRDYDDGVSAPAGAHRASPRHISNLVVAQGGPRPSSAGASDYLWQWGQLLDHDIDLTGVAVPHEPLPIAVPAGDPHFDPTGSGETTIAFERSLYSEHTGVREQLNEITAFIDASFVYGADAERAAALRANDGTGRLATSEGDLLPWNDAGLPNAMPPGADPADFFLAGDLRANEQVGLTAMHTLFVREHNRIADLARDIAPWLPGDIVYEIARTIVAAEVQAITYNEFLPLLLGADALPPYAGYRPRVDPGIANEFSAAAYRLGHSMLSPTLLRLDADGGALAEGHLALREAFFAPARITGEGGIEPILRGLAAQTSQEIDVHIVDDVRNFRFGPPGAGGFDLAALNIQRGRDHGLASYNQTRLALGLPPASSFADVSARADVQARLAAAYESVEDIDLWVGALAEDPAAGALVGPLLRAILVDQFTRLRDGDRFFYRNALPGVVVDYLDQQRLSDVIRRNTEIGNELPDDVFRA